MPEIAGARKSVLCENLSFVSKEAYKKLRTNTLLALEKRKDGSIIGVTSAQPSEGKSLTAINLAYTFSELDKKVLLIDCDLRRPSVGEKLNIPLFPGFSDLLTDVNDLSSVINHYEDNTGKMCFDVIPGGESHENPSEMFLSARFERLLEALRTAYDYILIDLPPLGAVIDAVEVGKCTDGMIVVVRENNSPLRAFTSCIHELEFAHINILGVVMNGSLEGVGKKYQYKYKYSPYR